MVVSSLLHFSAYCLLWVRETLLPAGPPGRHSLKRKQGTNTAVMGPRATGPWHKLIQSLLPSLEVQSQLQTPMEGQTTQAQPDQCLRPTVSRWSLTHIALPDMCRFCDSLVTVELSRETCHHGSVLSSVA